jgi:hypothetical protein
MWGLFLTLDRIHVEENGHLLQAESKREATVSYNDTMEVATCVPPNDILRMYGSARVCVRVCVRARACAIIMRASAPPHIRSHVSHRIDAD